MITVKNESKRWINHISCKCKCRFDGRKCNSDQWRNTDNCGGEKTYVCEIYSVWNPATCNCKNLKYLASTMDYSAIMCDEVIES